MVASALLGWKCSNVGAWLTLCSIRVRRRFDFVEHRNRHSLIVATQEEVVKAEVARQEDVVLRAFLVGCQLVGMSAARPLLNLCGASILWKVHKNVAIAKGHPAKGSMTSTVFVDLCSKEKRNVGPMVYIMCFRECVLHNIFLQILE